MAWSAPSSVTTGDLITAATWNQDVVDNNQFLYDERIMSVGGWRDNDFTTTTSGTYAQMFHWFHFPGDQLTASDLSIYMAYVIARGSSATTAWAVVYEAGTAISASEVSSTYTSSTQGSISYSGDMVGDAAFSGGSASLDIYMKSSNGSTSVRLWDSNMFVVG